MKKREICERLIDLRDNMIHGQDSANSMGELSCVLSATDKLIRDLILDISDSINYENEKLMEIYKAWEKWDKEPCSSGQRVLAELEADIMEVVHNVMECIKKEKKDA